MSPRSCITVGLLAPLLVVGSLAAHAATQSQGVAVALTPSQQVTPGGVFDLYIEVTQPGDPFNGFDAVIGYDPAVLTLVPLVPVSLQEGSYMTGACGNTFHDFRAGAGTDTITDVLLCNNVALTGPGQVYHLRFRASSTPQLTTVQFLPGLQFYNAGIRVRPVVSSNAIIGIGMEPTLGVASSTPVRLSLTAAPNPTPGGLVFTIVADRSGPEILTVFDLQGRAVRRFADTISAPGAHRLAWDGRSDAGVRLAPGVYIARLELAGRAAWSRIRLVR